MSFLIAATLAASAATLPTCSWDRPGVNPFMGNVVASVDRYTDIPEPVRATLKKRMAARQYDEIAAIKRDTIEGRHRYSDLREMHFGQGQICRTVTRSNWTPANEERGLVYCESGHCLIVPTVCRNVSRVTRLPEQKAAAASAGAVPAAPAAEAPPVSLMAPATDDGAPSFAGRLNEALPSPMSGPATAGDPVIGGWAGGGDHGADGGRSNPSFAMAALGGGGRGLPGDERRLQRETIDVAGKPVLAVPPGPPVLPTSPVPEPATWGLMLAGLAAVGMRRRRQGR